ncbi:MAG TPA: hypothetical protein PLK35_01475 [Candidatus Moranbacteria bacterium]|nr:hypothetical protein [Candidatus Moranbacteria bacterium]
MNKKNKKILLIITAVLFLAISVFAYNFIYGGKQEKALAKYEPFGQYSGNENTKDGVILSACSSAEILKPEENSPVFYHGIPINFSGRGIPGEVNYAELPFDPPLKIIGHSWTTKGCIPYGCGGHRGGPVHCWGTKEAVEISETAKFSYLFDVPGTYSVFYKVYDDHLSGFQQSECDSVTFDVGWRINISISDPDPGRIVKLTLPDGTVKQGANAVWANVKKGDRVDIEVSGEGFERWEGDIAGWQCGESLTNNTCTDIAMKVEGFDRDIVARFSSTCSPDCDCAKNTCIGKTCGDGCGGTCNGEKDCGGSGEDTERKRWKEVAP